MATTALDPVLQHIRKLADAGASAADAELLERFARRREEAAFEALVRRYGPAVLGVGRRVLHDRDAAEDVFQATFLVLARKAHGLGRRGSVGGWLYTVAHRLALKAKAEGQRRRERETRAVHAAARDPLDELTARELCGLLDEELQRLPEKYRLPLLLCCMEGKARDEAARQLGWTPGRVKAGLERGREALRRRLERRGVSLSAVLLAAGLVQQSASASAALLVGPTVKAARTIAAGEALTGVSSSATILADEMARSAFAAKGKTIAALLLAASLLAAVGYQLAAVGEPALEDAKAVPAKPAADEQKPHPDLHGDPLPKDAIARLGSGRLRTARYRQFTPDGRRIVLDRADGGLQFYDVPTGKPSIVIRATDVPGRDNIIGSTIGFTADGKHLAAVCWEGRSGIWETATGRLVRWLESGRFYSVIKCDFSPDGKLLAVGAGRPDDGTEGITVGVYEVESGRQLFTTPGTNSVFAPNGKSLITWNSYSGGGRQTSRLLEVPTGKVLNEFTHNWQLHDFFPPSDGVRFFEVTSDRAIKVWDAATGKVKHTVRGPEGFAQDQMYVRYAPGRRELIAVGVKPAGVWCWDRETGEQLWKFPLPAKVYYPELSRDGTVLVLGDIEGTVRILDAATGKERTTFKPVAIGHSTSVHVSPDGKTIATTSGGIFTMTIAFWDAATGKPVSDLPGHVSAITAAAFAPDGKTVFTIGKDATLRSWDAVTGRALSRAVAEPTTHMAVSADGKTLFTASADEGIVRVLDAHTGKSTRQVRAFAKTLVGLALTADGKRLITAGRDDETSDSLVRVHDAATGTKLRELGRSDTLIEQIAPRPDGETVATTHRGQHVSLWDAAGKMVVDKVGRGERKSSMDGYKVGFVTANRIGSVGLSPDGRRLAYSDQEQGIVIVNAHGGREVGQVKPRVEYQNPSIREDLRDILAFSPDGQTIAWSGVESTAEVYLIEVRTAQVRGRLPGDSYPVQHLVFSPDGSRLLSAGPDGSALIWDLLGSHGRKTGEGKPLAAAEIESCWTDLAGDDAARAYQAIRKLATSPTAVVAFLTKQLQPVAAPDAKRLAKLITDLDGDAFATREAATNELTTLGSLVEPALREALDKAPSAESRRRIEQLLAKLDNYGSTGEPLRASRALEVLEHIGTPEARQLLKSLAAGAPGAWPTREAKAALDRLLRSPTR